MEGAAASCEHDGGAVKCEHVCRGGLEQSVLPQEATGGRHPPLPTVEGGAVRCEHLCRKGTEHWAASMI